MVFFAAGAKNGLAVNRQVQNILMPFTNARAAYTSTLHAEWQASGTKRAESFGVPENQWIFLPGYEHKHGRKNVYCNRQLHRGQIYKNWRFILQAVQAFICVILGKLLYLASPFLPKKHREILSSTQGGWMHVRHLVQWSWSSANNQNKVWDFDTISLQS